MQLINKGRILRTFDKDAKKFINTIKEVEGIFLTEIERWYINTIVSNFKSTGAWDKCDVILPLISSTANSFKYNLKDSTPIIIDFGGMDLNNYGLDGRTRLNSDPVVVDYDLTTLENRDFHIGYYCGRLSPDGFKYEIGASTRVPPVSMGFGITVARSDGYAIYGNDYTNEFIATSNASLKKGAFIINGISDSISFYTDRVDTINGSRANVNLRNESTYLLLGNGWNFEDNASNKIISFFTIGKALSDIQAKQMSHIVTVAQGILGRK